MYCKVPGTAREIIEDLMAQNFSVKQIAEMLGVTVKTIYRIKKGVAPHPKTHINLIQLYLLLFKEKVDRESGN